MINYDSHPYQRWLKSENLTQPKHVDLKVSIGSDNYNTKRRLNILTCLGISWLTSYGFLSLFSKKFIATKSLQDKLLKSSVHASIFTMIYGAQYKYYERKPMDALNYSRFARLLNPMDSFFEKSVTPSFNQMAGFVALTTLSTGLSSFNLSVLENIPILKNTALNRIFSSTGTRNFSEIHYLSTPKKFQRIGHVFLLSIGICLTFHYVAGIWSENRNEWELGSRYEEYDGRRKSEIEFSTSNTAYDRAVAMGRK